MVSTFKPEIFIQRCTPPPTPPHPTPPTSTPTPPYPILPYPTLPYPTLPYPTLPYPTLPYPTLPYPTLPYPTPAYSAPVTLESSGTPLLHRPLCPYDSQTSVLRGDVNCRFALQNLCASCSMLPLSLCVRSIYDLELAIISVQTNPTHPTPCSSKILFFNANAEGGIPEAPQGASRSRREASPANSHHLPEAHTRRPGEAGSRPTPLPSIHPHRVGVRGFLPSPQP
jgi:hypothetical protein